MGWLSAIFFPAQINDWCKTKFRTSRISTKKGSKNQWEGAKVGAFRFTPSKPLELAPVLALALALALALVVAIYQCQVLKV